MSPLAWAVSFGTPAIVLGCYLYGERSLLVARWRDARKDADYWRERYGAEVERHTATRLAFANYRGEYGDLPQATARCVGSLNTIGRHSADYYDGARCLWCGERA